MARKTEKGGKSQQERFQKLKSGLSDFLVPTLVSADEWQGFMGREVDSFLRSLVSSKARLPKILQWRVHAAHVSGAKMLKPHEVS